MTNGFIDYPGLLNAKGATYTQTRGVSPDRIQVRMIPQQQPIAAVGDLVFGFGFESLTLPDCLADKAGITVSQKGFVGTLIFEDRRWRWSRYRSVGYHWNERDANGDIVEATRKDLRAMMVSVLADMGETNIDVAQVPNNFYPEVDVRCIRPDQLLDSLTSNYGFDVCLGFGMDAVRVVQIGLGDPLPTGGELMTSSSGADPPTPPRVVEVCFSPSEAQARFKLEAVGLDTDGEIKPIDDLSYKPDDGWENEPEEMSNIEPDEDHSEARELAVQTVFRWYRISKFSDDTLNFPDGSGVLDNIGQILPTLPVLLDTSTSNVEAVNPAKKDVRVFGVYTHQFSATLLDNDIDSLVSLPYRYDRTHGIVQFDNRVTKNDHVTGGFMPAELYLEAAFRIRDTETFQFTSYVKDINVTPSGQGYHSIRRLEDHAKTIVSYDSGHVASSATTNRAQLDADAALLAASAVGSYTFEARELRWYNRPMFNVRLDGLTQEIQLVITDGTDGEPGHYTLISQNMEFDPFIRTSFERKMGQHVLKDRLDVLPRGVLLGRGEKGHD
jgi:hypothetical protein